MSFLQLISKPAERHSSNPAFLHLQTRNPLPRWNSFKSEPKEHPTDTVDPAPHPTPHTKKPRTARLNRTLFARGKNPANNDSPKPYPEQQRSSPSPFQKHDTGRTNRVQYHHSFSNYLSKKPPGRRSNLQGRLMYFDLNEIVNKIASPIKLEQKVEGGGGGEAEEEQQTYRPPIKHNNLAHYQKFLRQVHNEKNRYHQHQIAAISRTEETQRASRKYLSAAIETDALRRRPNTLILRKPAGKERGGDDIQPWTENEEQHSPIRTAKHQSAFQPRHAIVQDFEDLMT